MAIAKLLLLVVVVSAQQYAVTAPNVRPPIDQLRKQRGSERGLPYITALFRVMIWSWAFLQGSVLFALSGYCPPQLARPLLHSILPSSTLASDPLLDPLTTLTTLTPSFFTGALLTLTGTLLRSHCFHALGPRFTFELAIRPSHALVTDGVYGVVRHPSYTGGLAIGLGWLLFVLDRRGWVVGVFGGWIQNRMTDGIGTGSGSGSDGRERGAVMALTSVWAAALGIMYVVVNKRMNKEDAMLEENFGEEWRAWAKRVPCRLVPGVY